MSTKAKRSFVGCIIPAKHLVDQYSYGPRKPRTSDEAKKLAVSQQLEVSKSDANEIVNRINSYASAGRPIALTTEHLNIKNKIVRTGDVTRAWFDHNDGSVYAQFSFDDTEGSPGADAIRLLDDGWFQQVSLQHDLTTNEPYEVSLCAKGARTGSLVTAELSNGEYKPVVQRVSVLASAGTAADQTTTSEPPPQIIDSIVRVSASNSSMAAAPTAPNSGYTLPPQQLLGNDDLTNAFNQFSNAFQIYHATQKSASASAPAISMNAPSNTGFGGTSTGQLTQQQLQQLQQLQLLQQQQQQQQQQLMQQQQQQQQQQQPQQPLDAKDPLSQPAFEKGESPEDVTRIVQSLAAGIPTKEERLKLVSLLAKLYQDKHKATQYQTERFAQFGQAVQRFVNSLTGSAQKDSNVESDVRDALSKGDTDKLVKALEPVMVQASDFITNAKKGAISDFRPASWGTAPMQTANTIDPEMQKTLFEFQQAFYGRTPPPNMTQNGSSNFNFIPNSAPGGLVTLYTPQTLPGIGGGTTIYSPYAPVSAPAAGGIQIAASAGSFPVQQQLSSTGVENAFTRHLDPELAAELNSNSATSSLAIPESMYSLESRKRFRSNATDDNMWHSNYTVKSK